MWGARERRRRLARMLSAKTAHRFGARADRCGCADAQREQREEHREPPPRKQRRRHAGPLPLLSLQHRRRRYAAAISTLVTTAAIRPTPSGLSRQIIYAYLMVYSLAAVPSKACTLCESAQIATQKRPEQNNARRSSQSMTYSYGLMSKALAALNATRCAYEERCACPLSAPSTLAMRAAFRLGPASRRRGKGGGRDSKTQPSVRSLITRGFSEKKAVQA